MLNCISRLFIAEVWIKRRFCAYNWIMGKTKKVKNIEQTSKLCNNGLSTSQSVCKSCVCAFRNLWGPYGQEAALCEDPAVLFFIKNRGRYPAPRQMQKVNIFPKWDLKIPNWRFPKIIIIFYFFLDFNIEFFFHPALYVTI